MVMIGRATFLHAVQKLNQLVSISSAMFLLNVLCGAQWRSCFCKNLSVCNVVHNCTCMYTSCVKKDQSESDHDNHGISLDMAIETVQITMSLVPDFSFVICIATTQRQKQTVLFNVCISQQRQVLFVTSTRTLQMDPLPTNQHQYYAINKNSKIPLNEPEWKNRSYNKKFDYVNQNVKRKKPYNSTK